MPFPLHEAIIKNKLSEAIKLINQGTFDPNEVNDQGLSLLQLAAKFGMLEITIWLLYAGAKVEVEDEFKHEVKREVKREVKHDNNLSIQDSNKSPLYHAMENGHTLVVQVLLACGANQYAASRLAREFNDLSLAENLQQLTLNSFVTDALYYWSIVNYKDKYSTKLIKRLTPDFITSLNAIDIDDSREYKSSEEAIPLASFEPLQILTSQSEPLNPWLVFAIQQKKTLLVRELKELGQKSPSGLRSPGYWAAKNQDDSMFSEFCKSDDEIVETLCQLQADDVSVLENIYKNKNLVPLTARNKFDNSVEQLQEIIPLSAIQRLAYKAAARGDKINLIKFFQNLLSFKDRYETIKFAFAKKDYIALKNILDLKKINLKGILSFELSKREFDRNFLSFLFVATGRDALKFSLSLWQLPVKTLDSLIEVTKDEKISSQDLPHSENKFRDFIINVHQDVQSLSDNFLSPSASQLREKLLKNFMEVALNSRGLSQQIVNSILNCSDESTLANKFNIIKFLDLSEIKLTNLILDILRYQFPSQSFLVLLNLPTLTLAKRIENLASPLSISFARLLNEKFDLFNISIKKIERNYKLPELQNMLGVIWCEIYDVYLNHSGKNSLMLVSSEFHNMLTISGIKNYRLLKLQRQITLLDNYINLASIEKKKKSYFSHRRRGPRENSVLYLAFIFSLSLIMELLNILLFIPGGKENYANLTYKFNHALLPNNNTCIQQCPETEYKLDGLASACDLNSKYCDSLFDSICSNLCEHIRDSLLLPVLSTSLTSMVAIPFFLITIAGVISVIYKARGEERFNHVTIINFFVDKDNRHKAFSAINALTAEFRAPAVMADFNHVDQFAGMNVLSTFGAYLTKTTTLKNELKTQLDALKAEIKTQKTKEDIEKKEVKIAISTNNINEVKPKPKSNNLFSMFFNNKTGDQEVKEIEEEKTKNDGQVVKSTVNNWYSKFTSKKPAVQNEKSPLLDKSDSSLELR